MLAFKCGMVLSEMPEGEHLSSSVATVTDRFSKDTGSCVRHGCKQVLAEAAASALPAHRADQHLQPCAPCLQAGLSWPLSRTA